MRLPPSIVPSLDDFARDGGEKKLFDAVARAFAIEFSEEETAGLDTVGKLFAAIVAKSPASAGGDTSATGIAFQRLRNALIGQAPRDAVVPETKLASVVRMPAYRFHAELERRAGLHVPGFHFSQMGNIGLLLILVGGLLLIASVVVVLPKWLGPAAFIAGVGLMYADPRQLPDVTLGAFARELAMLNHAVLARHDARRDEVALWEALVSLLQAETGAKGAITPDTRLF